MCRPGESSTKKLMDLCEDIRKTILQTDMELWRRLNNEKLGGIEIDRCNGSKPH